MRIAAAAVLPVAIAGYGCYVWHQRGLAAGLLSQFSSNLWGLHNENGSRAESPPGQTFTSGTMQLHFADSTLKLEW